MRELPTLLAANYASTTTGCNDFTFGGQMNQGRLQVSDLIAKMQNPSTQSSQQMQQEKEPIMSAARIVKVFIADPNNNIPLDKRVLYTGDEKLTDLTDQELFFEMPIAELLGKHNAERVKTVDKEQSAKFGRDIFLEPAKIRDLKMVVVTVATF